jgi:uncharacterized membrane protein YebE (DUF533 family)
MAEMMLALGTMFSKVMTMATTAGSALVSNAGTIGTALSAGSTIYGGIQANQESKAVAASMKKKGDNEFSAAQRQSLEKRRQTELIMSRQKAVAAASGGGASDPSVQSIMEKTQQEGDYSAMMDMYNGTVNRGDLYAEADTVRREGRSKMLGSFMDAGTTIYGDIERRKNKKLSYSF